MTNNVSRYIDLDEGRISIECGLGYSLRLIEELSVAVEKLDNPSWSLSVEGLSGDGTSGLYVQDQVRGHAIRMTSNRTAGCGRIYFGKWDDFDYPSHLPIEGLLSPIDWEFHEIQAVVQQLMDFLMSDLKSSASS